MMGQGLEICKSGEEWDSLLVECPSATAFHQWDWLKITEKNSRSRLFPLIWYVKGVPRSVFPVFLQKKGFFNLALSPPPQASIPYLGPLMLGCSSLRQSEKEKLLLDFQEASTNFIFNELGASYYRIHTPPGFFDSRPFKWAGFKVSPLYTYYLDLSPGKEAVLGGFKKELRRNINAAAQKDVKIYQGSLKELEAVYSSVSGRYQQQGRFSGIGKEYLYDLFKRFYPKNLQVFVSEVKGEFAGGLITTAFNGRVSAWVGVAKTELKGIPANDILAWETIKWACDTGASTYELIGANTLRLCQFKAKYNPSPVLYFSVKKYSSPVFEIGESLYLNVCRPLLERFHPENNEVDTRTSSSPQPPTNQTTDQIQ